MSTAKQTAPGAMQSLRSAQRIERGIVIGVVTFSGSAPAAMELPLRDELMRSDRLEVPRPAGKRLNNPALSKAVANELSSQLGGWFSDDLNPFIELYDSLVSDQQKEEYQRGGMTIAWDTPKVAFYYLAFERDGWQVQAIGEPGGFHCIFFGHLLTAAEALQPSGLPAAHPAGPVEPFLKQAAPTLMRHPLTDQSAMQEPNLYDSYLVEGKTTVKAGVRQRLAQDEPAVPDDNKYFYGVRINLDLRSP